MQASYQDLGVVGARLLCAFVSCGVSIVAGCFVLTAARCQKRSYLLTFLTMGFFFKFFIFGASHLRTINFINLRMGDISYEKCSTEIIICYTLMHCCLLFFLLFLVFKENHRTHLSLDNNVRKRKVRLNILISSVLLASLALCKLIVFDISVNPNLFKMQPVNEEGGQVSFFVHCAEDTELGIRQTLSLTIFVHLPFLLTIFCSCWCNGKCSGLTSDSNHTSSINKQYTSSDMPAITAHKKHLSSELCGLNTALDLRIDTGIGKYDFPAKGKPFKLVRFFNTCNGTTDNPPRYYIPTEATRREKQLFCSLCFDMNKVLWEGLLFYIAVMLLFRPLQILWAWYQHKTFLDYSHIVSIFFIDIRVVIQILLNGQGTPPKKLLKPSRFLDSE